ncbi:hypothetical protein LCGC14_2080750 [marine sediment metagenome]|uniref:Bacteriophage phiJL001 Gp84 C-terminal domain-containing protein n=1 Tax=marine sediment metagenome TaxID=412755 RepID=A0A0F9EFY5_9ZZZZ
MSKTVGAALATHLAGAVTSVTTLARIQRTDGTVIPLTSHDADIVFDDGDGSQTYLSVVGYSRTAVSGSSEMSVDSIDFRGLFDALGVTSEDFLVGRMDFAAVRLHLVNWKDLTQGSVVLRQGTVGQVTTSEDFIAEVRGMLQKFFQEIVEVTSQTCRAKFGDSGDARPRCYIELNAAAWSTPLATTARAPADAKNETVVKPLATQNDRWFVSIVAGDTGGSEPSWDTTIGNTTVDNTVTWEAIQARRITAVIATIVNDMEFTVTPDITTDAPDAFFGAGSVEFTSGNNNGLVSGLSSWTLSTLTVKTFFPVPRTMTVGDALTLVAGCDRINTTCEDDYDNKINFRGEDHLPGNMQLFKFPNQPSG